MLLFAFLVIENAKADDYSDAMMKAIEKNGRCRR